MESFAMPDSALTGPSAWLGEEMARHPERWLTQLSKEEIIELENAASNFIKSDKNIGELNTENFNLATLGRRFARLRESLISGIGFEVIRGLPINGYDQQMAATIFCGIGAHIGRARSQNAKAMCWGMYAILEPMQKILIPESIKPRRGKLFIQIQRILWDCSV